MHEHVVLCGLNGSMGGITPLPPSLEFSRHLIYIIENNLRGKRNFFYYYKLSWNDDVCTGEEQREKNMEIMSCGRDSESEENSDQRLRWKVE